MIHEQFIRRNSKSQAVGFIHHTKEFVIFYNVYLLVKVFVLLLRRKSGLPVWRELLQKYGTRAWAYRVGQGWVFGELTPDELRIFRLLPIYRSDTSQKGFPFREHDQNGMITSGVLIHLADNLNEEQVKWLDTQKDKGKISDWKVLPMTHM